jgi:glycine cleavage system H protein
MQPFPLVESVKAASDVYAPISGEIVAANERLAEEPELVNTDPFGEGWLMRMQPGNAAELDELLDAEAYQQVVAESD